MKSSKPRRPPHAGCEAATAPAPSSRADFDLDTFLPYRLAVAAEAVSTGLATVYADRFDISISEWRILANLGRHGAMTAGEAARRSSLDKVQVARAIKLLKARKLIERRSDHTDRRRVALTLTADGERLRAEIAQRALAWERAVLSGLTAGERAALSHALSRLTRKAKALPR